MDVRSCFQVTHVAHPFMFIYCLLLDILYEVSKYLPYFVNVFVFLTLSFDNNLYILSKSFYLTHLANIYTHL